MGKSSYIDGTLAAQQAGSSAAEIIGFPMLDQRQSTFAEMRESLRYGSAMGTRTTILTLSDKLIAALICSASVVLLAFAIVYPFI